MQINNCLEYFVLKVRNDGYRPRIISDKGLFESYVLKETRTVLESATS